MKTGHITKPVYITVDAKHLEAVEKFTYLGSIVCHNGDANTEIQTRKACLSLATAHLVVSFNVFMTILLHCHPNHNLLNAKCGRVQQT